MLSLWCLCLAEHILSAFASALRAPKACRAIQPATSRTRQFYVRLLLPLELPPPHHECQTTEDRTYSDQHDDRGMRDEPQDDRDVITVPRSAWTMAEKRVGLGVKLVGQDEELVRICEELARSAMRDLRGCRTTLLTRVFLAFTSIVFLFFATRQEPALEYIARELRPCGEINRQVREKKIPVARLQLIRHLSDHRMLRPCGEDVVVDA